MATYDMLGDQGGLQTALLAAMGLELPVEKTGDKACYLQLAVALLAFHSTGCFVGGTA